MRTIIATLRQMLYIMGAGNRIHAHVLFNRVRTAR